MAEQPTETINKEPLLSRSLISAAPYYMMFFLWSLGTGAQQLARPLFAAELGASPFLVVLITASNAMSHLISAPITGFVADRIGRKPLVLLGNAIRGFTLVGQFFAESYWQFFALEFAGGIGVAMWSTSSSVAMADFTTRENRGRLMAVRALTSRFGMMAGPVSGALVIGAFYNDLRYVFLFNAVTKVFIHLLVMYLAKETAPEANRRRQAGDTRPRAKLDVSIFMTRGFLALIVTSFALHMMLQGGAYGALFPIQAQSEVGLSAAAIGKIMSIGAFIGLLVTYPNGWAVDRIGRKPTMIPGLLLLATAAFMLSRLDTVNEVYIMIFFYGLGSTMSQGGAQAFVIDIAPEDRRGTFMGIWTLVGNIGGIFAPLMIGAIASSFGYAPGYLLVCVLLVLSAAVMAIFGPETGGTRRAQVTAETTPEPPITPPRAD